MNADIITIGDEILIGQTIDTNSAWLGALLQKEGIDVNQISSIRDTEEHIITALNEASERSKIVLITGGLGPTQDDVTKQTLAKYFNSGMMRNQEVLGMIENYFESRGREMLEVNRQQADVPEVCEVIINQNGTAPGMWFEKDGVVFVSMPGVPYEMKGLMKDSVLDKLKTRFKLPELYHKTVLTIGVGESYLAEMIKGWEHDLRKEGLFLAYLPSLGIVKLRISAKDKVGAKKLVDDKIEALKSIIPHLIYGYDKDTHASLVGEKLREKGATLATAESCTGGYVAHQITSVSGSSNYYEGSVIAYSYEVKSKVLGVSKETLLMEGAVSEMVVVQMAQGVREHLDADYSIALSGIAGPDGGTDEKPVGTVWIAVAGPDQVIAKRFRFSNNRERNIHLSSLFGMDMLLKMLEGKSDLYNM